MKIVYSQRLFKIYSNTKFHWTPSNGNRVVSCRQTDRYNEAYSPFLQFYNAPKM